ncbi:MAG: DUF4268 domain-containing protein [Chloroflexi bacterium]|nr:DUF4268 domain-containing protein [Chloroflexota bacterium]MYE42384.1 DUF4268 domain-containing protein [Chloroflexota bacterium]
MTAPNLAKIERVDLREAWPNEARDFTPWLAENIAELGEALGIDLELQQTEAAVGGYSLDVLATDLNQNRQVIIENQLETTDHDHLGKLLTYAAGYDASVVVWLTKEFREEHRQALDWINQRTGEDTHFFGVVVELWKIGNSLPAPHFRLAAAPNDWRKKTISRVRSEVGALTEKEERHQGFFRLLYDALGEQNFALPRNRPSYSAYLQAHIGRVYFGAHFTSQKEARVFCYLNGDVDWNRQLLTNLELYKEKIHSELESLNWQQLPKTYRISLARPGSIDDNPDTLTEIRDWMTQNLIKFKQVFDPLLAEFVDQNPLVEEQPTIE